MNGAIPPPLPSRSNSKSGPSSSRPPLSPSSTEKCDCPKGKCIHNYDYVPLQETPENFYEQLNSTEELDMNARLRKIEDNQIRLRLEFNQFQNDVKISIKSLETSVKEAKELTKSIGLQMRESSKLLKDSLDRVHLSLLENSDHLGKQILDARRDIMTASRNGPLPIKKT